MTDDRALRLATRGSDLALRQAAGVQEALATSRHPVDLVEVETTGDRITDELIHRLGRVGAFVRALDERVLEGDCDAAVHSMKDMPTEFPDDLVVAGVPERAPAGDVLVTPDGDDLDDLPQGATVGTSSLRRTAQLLNARPDLEVRPLRGNVDTRIEKLLAPRLQREHERRLGTEEEQHSEEMRRYEVDPEGVLDDPTGDGEGGDEGNGDERDGDERDDDAADSDDADDEFEPSAEEWFDALSELERRSLERDVDREYDAIVLAEAGLRRSGLFHQIGTSRLPRSEFVPAPGQGAIAITAVDEDVVSRIDDVLDHAPTRVATTVERTVLAELGGGCIAPIGVHATVQGEYVKARAQVLSTDGTEVVEAVRDLPVTSHADAAVEFAADLADRGAADLVEAARDDEPADAPARREEPDDAADDAAADGGGT